MVNSYSSDALRDSFAERIARRPIVIDGGLSTQLEAQGVVFNSPLWTGQALLDDPSTIERAHRAFVDAGADVVITASYQISRAGFEAIGRTAAEAEDALQASVDVAFKAAEGTSALVAASVGPFGAIRHDGSEYRGNYGVSKAELESFHRERLAVLASAKPDLLAIETIPDLIEVEALVAALDAAPGIPAWLSVTIGPDGKLWAGQSLGEVARAVEQNPEIVALGINCFDPDLAIQAISELASVSTLPIVIYPNGGGKWSAETGQWSEPHRHLAVATYREWSTAGARGIGGCCGVGATDLETITQTLRG
jgi:homocysteine S-methyltransferase